MSHSVFKEQKCFNFRTLIFSGFSVEAADNLPNLLVMSTRFCKKVFIKNTCSKFLLAEATFVSNKAGYSSDRFRSRNPQVQLFFHVSKINFASPKSRILFCSIFHFTEPIVLNKAGYSSDPNESRNPKIKLFSTTQFNPYLYSSCSYHSVCFNEWIDKQVGFKNPLHQGLNY